MPFKLMKNLSAGIALFVTAAEMDVLPPIAGQLSVSPRSSKFTTGASTGHSSTAFPAGFVCVEKDERVD
jgi:hypothetical protein